MKEKWSQGLSKMRMLSSMSRTKFRKTVSRFEQIIHMINFMDEFTYTNMICVITVLIYIQRTKLLATFVF